MSGLRVRTAAEKAERAAHRAYVTGKPVEESKKKQWKRKYQPDKATKQREARDRTRSLKRDKGTGLTVAILDQRAREAVRKRSGGVCEWCRVNAASECHHVRTKGAHRELRFDEDNLLDLCFWCHIPGAHSKDRRAFDMEFVRRFRERAEAIGLVAWLRLKGEVIE